MNQQDVTPAASEMDLTGMVLSGRYKLLERIGDGGMGTVWVAEQTDPVRRTVALKLIKPGMDSKSVLARFDAERQALALMDHPNIAKVLDGGLTENGRPFFVMEYVKGVPITEYCDAARLSVDERLKLFMEVCSAVQHAHQKGIIHRDLKPSNILVAPYDDKPVPKVIDFGLAKALYQSLTDRTLHTAHEMVLGTPLYMSPEQAQLNNLDVDTRSDIYSLGVLLYELLTGTTPLEKKRFTDAAWDEVRRIIREEEPQRPSARLSSTATLPSVAACRRTEPVRLTKQVRGELDWIVMKALEKDRTRRYETANGLALDIERFLADEPVLAGPPSAGYRLRKFVRRNRRHVLAGLIVLLALLAGIAGTTWGLFRAEAARKVAVAARKAEADRADGERQARVQAEAEKAKAERAEQQTLEDYRAATDDAIAQLIGSKPEVGTKERTYLENTLKRWQEFAARQTDDERGQAIRAEGHQRIGVLWQKLGRLDDAHLAYENALNLWKELAVRYPAAAAYHRNLATTHHNLAALLVNLGQRDAARAEYEQARELQKKLVVRYSAVPTDRQALATTHTDLGILLNELGQHAVARSEYEQARELLEKLTSQYPAVRDYQRYLSLANNNLGTLLVGQGDWVAARVAYEQAGNLQKKLADRYPADPGYRYELAATHNNLGALLSSVGQRDAARAEYEQARGLDKTLADQYPAVPVYQQKLAQSHSNLGLLMADLGEAKAARAEYEQACHLQRRLADQYPAVPAYLHDLSRTHRYLGNLLRDLGQREAARSEYERARDLQKTLVERYPAVPDYLQDLAVTHSSNGSLLARLGERTAAWAELERACKIQKNLADQYPAVRQFGMDLAYTYTRMGVMVFDDGRAAESLAWYDKAIATLDPAHRAEPRDFRATKILRNCHHNRANAYEALNRFAEAVKDRDRAVELSPAAEQPEMRAARAFSRLRAGQVAEAVAEVQELANSSNLSAVDSYNFACCYSIASGKVADKKQEYADRAMELLRKAVMAGFKDAAQMAKDTDLDPLRGRDDFKRLLEGLATAKKPAIKP